jgi:hypothetical protein
MNLVFREFSDHEVKVFVQSRRGEVAQLADTLALHDVAALRLSTCGMVSVALRLLIRRATELFVSVSTRIKVTNPCTYYD